MRAASLEMLSELRGNFVYVLSPDYLPSCEKVRVESRAGIASLEGVGNAHSVASCLFPSLIPFRRICRHLSLRSRSTHIAFLQEYLKSREIEPLKQLTTPPSAALPPQQPPVQQPPVVVSESEKAHTHVCTHALGKRSAS